MEANAHWLNKASAKQLQEYIGNYPVNVTEMNAVGSLSLEDLSKANLTTWRTASRDDPVSEAQTEANQTMMTALPAPTPANNSQPAENATAGVPAKKK